MCNNFNRLYYNDRVLSASLMIGSCGVISWYTGLWYTDDLLRLVQLNQWLVYRNLCCFICLCCFWSLHLIYAMSVTLVRLENGPEVYFLPTSHAEHRCGLLLEMSHSVWSVGHDPEPCKMAEPIDMSFGMFSGGSMLEPGGTASPQILPRPIQFFAGNFGLTFAHV